LISTDVHAEQNFELKSSYILDNYSLKNTNDDYKNTSLGTLLLSSNYKMHAFEFNLSVLGTHSGGSPTSFVNDAQILSNIDVEGNEGVKVY
jgi:hypothetical protein